MQAKQVERFLLPFRSAVSPGSGEAAGFAYLVERKSVAVVVSRKRGFWKG